MQTIGARSSLCFRIPTLVLALAGVFYECPALACGGGGITSQAGVVVDSQVIVVSTREAGTTDVVVHVSVPRAGSDFGLLIPVPSEPIIDAEPIPSSELELLDRATAPEIIIDEGDSEEPLIGCGSDKTGGDFARPRVTATQFVEVGPVVAASLKGDSAVAVEMWLQDNGFVLPSSDTQTLEQYVGTGSYFIAVKRSTKVAGESPQSIGLHYSLEGDHRMLSLAFAKIGADEQVGFTVFLANQTTLGPTAPFTALTLDDLDANLLKASYGDALREAVQSNGGKAFILESSTDASALAETLPRLSKLFDSNASITRATTVVARDELTTDAMFTTAVEQDIPNSRTLSFAPTKTRSSQPAWLGMIMFGAFLSFSFRRLNT